VGPLTAQYWGKKESSKKIKANKARKRRELKSQKKRGKKKRALRGEPTKVGKNWEKPEGFRKE